MKFKTSNFILCTVAAFGLAMLVACGDENTVEVTESAGMEVLAKGEKLPACATDNVGDLLYIADSAAVCYCTDGKWTTFNGGDGSGCSTKSVKDGVEVSCNGKVVGVLKNGSGSDGKSCSAVQDEKSKDIVITCETDDGKRVSYTIQNGKPGKTCSATQNADKTETVITCPDEDGKDASYSIKNGDPAKFCNVTQNAEKTETTITCQNEAGEDVSYVIQNGKPGTSCSVLSIIDFGAKKSGYKFICDDGQTGEILNGTDGADGSGCSTKDNGNGIVEVTCGTGEDKKTVELYKAVCGTVPYEPTKNICYKGTIQDFCGGEFYDPEKSKCIDDRRIVSLTFGTVEGYRTVTIDIKDVKENRQYKNTWMAENMNKVVNDGTQSWCYDGKAKNCETYGRLYTWAAAVGQTEEECGYGIYCYDVAEDIAKGKTIQGICFDGWHLPSKGEWDVLFDAVGGTDVAGTRLKSTEGWMSYTDEQNVTHSGNGTDMFGFKVLPAGDRGNWFGDLEKNAMFWTSTEEYRYDQDCVDHGQEYCEGIESYAWNVRNTYSNVGSGSRYSKSYGYSVRCVKND